MICVKTPVTTIARKKNIESIFNFLFVFFFIKKEKTKKINAIKKYQSELPNSVIFIKNSLKYLLLGELQKSLNILYKLIPMLSDNNILKSNIPNIENSIFKFFITLDG